MATRKMAIYRANIDFYGEDTVTQVLTRLEANIPQIERYIRTVANSRKCRRKLAEGDGCIDPRVLHPSPINAQHLYQLKDPYVFLNPDNIFYTPGLIPLFGFQVSVPSIEFGVDWKPIYAAILRRNALVRLELRKPESPLYLTTRKDVEVSLL
jgi:hypothetical protein